MDGAVDSPLAFFRRVSGAAFVAFAVLLGSIGGCASAVPQGDLTITLSTDYRPTIDFDEVRVEALGDVNAGLPVHLDLNQDFVRGGQIVRNGTAPIGDLRFRVSLFRGGQLVVSQGAAVAVRETTFTTVVITRSCFDAECPGGQVCIAGACESEGCAPGNPDLCRNRCSEENCSDDANLCGAAECVDGFCLQLSRCEDNERCEAGECVAQAPVTPDAGVATDDSGAATSDAGPVDAGHPNCGVPCTLENSCEQGRGDCSTGECVGTGEPLAAGVSCREAEGSCDLEEVCDGVSTACPQNAFEPVGVSCSGGFCNGSGECTSGCNPGDPCPTGDDCAIGELSCDTGVPVCVPMRAAAAGTVCRPAATLCDVAEVCDGSSMECPTNAFAGSAVRCRSGEEDCETDAFCTGTSEVCPANPLRNSAHVCRPATDDCDRAETCSGSSRFCPSDAMLPAGTECREADGDCDVAETCTGSSAACPSDGFASSSVVCRAAPLPCDEPETCTGSSRHCPPDAVDAAGTECRGTAGPCDVREVCDGSSKQCPTDRFLSSSSFCGLGGICRERARCTGSSASCPPASPSPAGTECFGPPGECATYACDGSGRCEVSRPFCPPGECCVPGDGCRPESGGRPCLELE